MGEGTEQQTTPASWRRIVEALNNPVQQRIVSRRSRAGERADSGRPGLGQDTSARASHCLPGAGRRENPHSIIALAYNRHAALEIRVGCRALIGDDAKGVTVLTCHALAMRLCGTEFC